MGRPAKKNFFDLQKSTDALKALIATESALGDSDDLLRKNVALFERIHDKPYAEWQVIEALAGANPKMSRATVTEAVTKIFARLSTERSPKAADRAQHRTADSSDKPKLSSQDASTSKRVPEMLAERDAVTSAQSAPRKADQGDNKPSTPQNTPHRSWDAVGQGWPSAPIQAGAGRQLNVDPRPLGENGGFGSGLRSGTQGTDSSSNGSKNG